MLAMQQHLPAHIRLGSAYLRSQELLPRIAVDEAAFQLYKVARRELKAALDEIGVIEDSPAFFLLLENHGIPRAEPRVDVPPARAGGSTA